MSEVEGGRVELGPTLRQGADRDLKAAMDAYLKLANGDVRLALEVSVADGLAVSKLVSTGFARWRQPGRRTRAD